MLSYPVCGLLPAAENEGTPYSDKTAGANLPAA